jgi:hypothetical protein
MSRLSRFAKGSREALAWGKKMRELRRAGKKTEREFFGPRGVFAMAGHKEHLKRNPKKKQGMLILKETLANGQEVIIVQVAPRRFHVGKDGEFQGGYDTLDEAKQLVTFFKSLGKDNPGAEWHEGMEHVAARHSRDAQTKEEKILFKGVEIAHKDSKQAARRMRMNHVSRPLRKNPLAVFGFANPPARISTGIAGVVYNICHEIRAEKTGVKKGLYRHPFSRKSGVQILALDNGDLLIHSSQGKRLWKPF